MASGLMWRLSFSINKRRMDRRLALMAFDNSQGLPSHVRLALRDLLSHFLSRASALIL